MRTKTNLKSLMILLLFLLYSSGFAQLSAIIRGSVVEDAFAGDIIQAKITIVNPIEKEVAARLYLADFQDSLEGERYLEADSTIRSNASWVSFAANEEVIPPFTTVEIPVEIAIPADSSVEGSYWSMIIVEAEAKTIAEADPTKEGLAGLGLEIINRHALNVITTVGDGYAELDFSNPRLFNNDLGQAIFSVDTENIGNRIAPASVYLDVYSMQGEVLGRIDAGRYFMRPGNPVNFTFDFSTVNNLIEETNAVGTEVIALDPGTYTTLMIVDAGGEDLFGSRFTIELEQ